MRKLPLVLALVAVLVVAAALPVGAAPSNGNSATWIDADCGEDGVVSVLVQNNTSGAAIFDGALDSNGRRYVLSWLDDRIYIGDHATEPAGDPDFAFVKTWGQRAGYSETLTCSGSVSLFGGEFTEFFDVVLSGK